jgi:hypothetical protein
MDFDELLSQSFQVSDDLAPAYRSQLASASQRLDIAPARPSLGLEESARVDEARRLALSEALATSWALIQPSGYNIQVLAVSMRLMVEVQGVDGIARAMRLIEKIIMTCSEQHVTARSRVDSAERESLDRKWGRYFDSVFEQVHTWLASQDELRSDRLTVELDRRAAELQELRRMIDEALPRAQIRCAWWSRSQQLLADLMTKRVSTNPNPELRHISADSANAAEKPARPDAELPESLPPQASSELWSANPTNTVSLRVTPRFWELQRSIAALESLLKGSQFEKASIVARDIEETLQSFQVLSYFPGLFAPFFELIARYAEPISRRRDMESVRTSALSQLYRADLARFVDLPLEEHE